MRGAGKEKEKGELSGGKVWGQEGLSDISVLQRCAEGLFMGAQRQERSWRG